MFSFLFGFLIGAGVFLCCGFFFLVGVLFSEQRREKEELAVENKYLQSSLDSMIDHYNLDENTE